ncbi:hypothetical protein GCM10010094_61580 [Streptomyces flaveus]|uniref:Uncharacterized protein n=1 Tax=Streptomyces flaveus TaxID=66370 RepID=A0A917VL41_9ACTN|nr:hypothetical protein GCM10010094_61580 [Streptomyces flaveus]
MAQRHAIPVLVDRPGVTGWVWVTEYGANAYKCFGQEARPWELVRQIAGVFRTVRAYLLPR